MKLFDHVKKKLYLCMLFRGDMSLARVYTGAWSLCRVGWRSRRKAWKHLIKFTNKLTS